MELTSAEIKMLRQLLNICRSENMDLYIDDIKTFKYLRSRINNFKPKRKEHFKKESLNKEEKFSKNQKKIKGKKTKYWHRRMRHKNNQALEEKKGNSK